MSDGSAAPVVRSGGTFAGRVTVGVLGLLGRLPERPLVAAADALGELWYRIAPSRRAQARANLARACEDLAATGRGPLRARRAATDPDALERLVRALFRHTVRYYLEVARAGTYTTEEAVARIDVVTPDSVREVVEAQQPIIVVGMHYGALELPAIEVVHLLGHTVTAPMELVGNPVLREWFLRSRARTGVDIIPLANARRRLLRAAAEGRSVGLVADRDLTGGGVMVPFFGHLAPIPPGPALMAIETGLPVYVSAARRAPGGRYRGSMIRVETPAEGRLRERVETLTTAIAGAFESLLAEAPEQWWGAFHPYWPDLALSGNEVDRAAAREAHDGV
jgi:phosphatidylinositol dimannoside acyltransferase